MRPSIHRLVAPILCRVSIDFLPSKKSKKLAKIYNCFKALNNKMLHHSIAVKLVLKGTNFVVGSREVDQSIMTKRFNRFHVKSGAGTKCETILNIFFNFILSNVIFERFNCLFLGKSQPLFLCGARQILTLPSHAFYCVQPSSLRARRHCNEAVIQTPTAHPVTIRPKERRNAFRTSYLCKFQTGNRTTNDECHRGLPKSRLLRAR